MPVDQPTAPMRTPLPALVTARLRAAGRDVDGFLRRFELPLDLEHAPTVIVPVGTLARFYDAAAQELDEPDLGLALAMAMPRGAYGVFEFGVRASSTVRDALDRLCRTMALFNRVARLEWSELDGTARCDMTVDGQPHGLGRHANEFFVALLVVWTRELVQRHFGARRVWFCHARPASIDVHRELFGCDAIAFDATSNGFAFAAAWLDTPLVEADAALTRAIDAQAKVELPHLDAPPLVFEMRRVLRSLGPGEPASIRLVARRLGHSPRSLQRHLAEQGTTFRRLLDEVRRDRVLDLEREGLSLAQIAARLGYQDLAAFRRALERWRR
ncbi:MAG TPA: AraC family transcriptional regulator ligand-binding domain-containing protein [Nannocystaceae bacterium]|nr:AraC family transcriptional regulator ligand-binding domain-containing protein [Nannocystaceae bacterium]